MLILEVAEFLYYHLLLTFVDKISLVDHNHELPEIQRVYRENLALKSQIRALTLELKEQQGTRPRVSVCTRAAQVSGYMLTRRNLVFRKYYSSTKKGTVESWAAYFRNPRYLKRSHGFPGRPPIGDDVRKLILRLKKENPIWGARRIQDELRLLGYQVSQPTIQKVLREGGFDPRHPRKRKWERVVSTARDMVWAMDYFAVKTVSGKTLEVFVLLDMYTREILELKVHEGLDVSAQWTTRPLAQVMTRLKRAPKKILHDRATQFKGHFATQMRVLEVEQQPIPPRFPSANGMAERAVQSVRFELVNHIRVRTKDELQDLLDEYRIYYNEYRPNQGIDGQRPSDRAVGKVVDISRHRERVLEKRSFANGMLNGYRWSEVDPPDRLAA